MTTEQSHNSKGGSTEAPKETTLKYECPHCDSTVEAEPHADDELVSCPVCKKPFKPEPPSARPKATVPLIVPGGEGDSTADPEKAAAPTAESADKAEIDVTRFRPAMFQAYPLRTILYVLIGCAGAVALGVGLYSGYWGVWLAGLAVMAFGLYRLIAWYFRIRYTDIKVTTRRLIITQGVFRTTSVEIPHANISDVYVSQDTFNHLTNVGDILITTTGDDKRTVILMSVVHPEEVADKIRAQRRDRD